MIVNKTSLTKEDLLFCRRKSGAISQNIPIRVFLLACGSYILHYCVPVIWKMIVKKKVFTPIYACYLLYLEAIFGVALIIYTIFMTRIDARREFNKVKNIESCITTFGDESVSEQFCKDAVIINHIYLYSKMECYFDCNNAINIQIRMDRKKFFLVIHDDGYVQGSREELIKLLEIKNILSVT